MLGKLVAKSRVIGKLVAKSRVMQSYRPKSQLTRKRNKRERANTPQRWSRRIRSLPPIPFDVLKIRKKMRKGLTNFLTDRISTTYLEKNKRNNLLFRESPKNIFANKNSLCGESVEILRIVPVVIYVKNPRKFKKIFTPDEVRVHIDDNPTCQMVSQAIDLHIQQKIKKGDHCNVHSNKTELNEHKPHNYNMLQCKRSKKMYH